MAAKKKKRTLKGRTVWVLEWHTKHDSGAQVFATREGAEAAIQEDMAQDMKDGMYGKEVETQVRALLAEGKVAEATTRITENHDEIWWNWGSQTVGP